MSASTATIYNVLDRADQFAVHRDLETYFGPRAERFIATYDRMRNRHGGRRFSVRGWCWPAFLFSFVWFFYRKMYALGAMILFLPLVLHYVLGGGASAVAIIWAVMGKSLYVQAAMARIAKADRLGLAGYERDEYLRRAGGVSIAGGVLGGLLFGAICVLLIAGVMQHAHRP